MIKGASMFSSAGVAETYFKDAGIDIVVANELIEKRGNFYQSIYPSSKMIIGDINNKEVKQKFINSITDDIKFLIATPPCQGVSTLGMNKKMKQMQSDSRNYLIFSVFDVIDQKDFDYIMIENVPRFLQLYFPYKSEFKLLEDILRDKYSEKYQIEIKVLNAKDYGVPQTRPRAIIKMYKHKLNWAWPEEQKEITLKEAIGELPSLEPGEKSNFKYHYAKTHNNREIEAMRHTPTGCSALKNEIYYPKKEDGSKIKGFHNTYKRMNWDAPAPARTMNSGNIGSHNNVHPGRLLPDGTYSDARVLTLRELFIVSSLPEEWNIPDGYTDNFIRQVIGEAIPPKLSFNIVKEIGKDDKMLKLNRSKDNKWILQKNISSSNLIDAFIEALEKQDNNIDNEEIKNKLKSNKSYKGRSKEGSTNTMGVRMSQMCFYMTGYKKNGKFLPSTTTQMYRKEGGTFPVDEAFLINLFSMQFPSPYSQTPDNFQIYMGRLIIKLLLDEKIDKKLYIDEFVWFLPFIEKIDENTYQELIKEILEYRKLSFEEKQNLFKSVKKYDEVFSNCMHEINYYFLRIFAGFKVFELVKDAKHNGGKIFEFKHGTGSTYRNDAIASRKKVSGYVKLSDSIINKAKILCNNYSAFDKPETQATAISKEDWIRDLYEFNMLDYIEDINYDKKYNDQVIKSVKDMVYHSKYGTNDGKSFENSLKPIFELFRENSNVEIISGAGDTDLLCVMKDNTGEFYKINVDAKKTKNKLGGIHTSRIMNHIRKNGSNYCIVVSPKFTKGAKTDIKGFNIVTIEAETLANYCLKECLNSNDGLADYDTIDSIIMKNQGKDITESVNELILERYQMA